MMYTRFYVILLSSLLLLGGCAAQETTSTPVVKTVDVVNVAPTTISPETTLLATLANGLQLFANFSKEQQLFTYDITTGVKEVVYTPTIPMRHVLVHPSGETLLIVSAKSASVAHVALYTASMERLYETDVVSYEVRATFDTVNSEQFSITAFTQSYDATVYTYVNKQWQPVTTSYPFVHMHDGELYTLIDGAVRNEQTTELIAQNTAHVLFSAAAVYYVTNDDATKLMTLDGAIQFLSPIVSLQEQFGHVYAWIREGTQYQLIQLQDMTPLLTADAPVPFFIDPEQRYIIYGEQYEWLQQQQKQPVQWLTIN